MWQDDLRLLSGLTGLRFRGLFTWHCFLRLRLQSDLSLSLPLPSSLTSKLQLLGFLVSFRFFFFCFRVFGVDFVLAVLPFVFFLIFNFTDVFFKGGSLVLLMSNLSSFAAEVVFVADISPSDSRIFHISSTISVPVSSLIFVVGRMSTISVMKLEVLVNSVSMWV